VLAVLAHRQNFRFRADLQTAAARAERVENSRPAENVTAGRKIGSFDNFADLFQRSPRLADQQDTGVDDFRQVMRRNIGRHADGNSRRTIHQEIRNARGKNFRLPLAFVVVGTEIDGLLVDVLKQGRRDLRKPRFGVPHRRGWIAIHGTKIALPVDQRIAHAERLRHADEGVIHGRVAVRVELTENFADDLGALAGRPVRSQAHLVHAEENAAMDGLQAVADIGQGASHDHAHRVIDVRPLHLVFDVDVHHLAVAVAPRSGEQRRRLRWRRWTLRGIFLVCHVICGVSSIVTFS